MGWHDYIANQSGATITVDLDWNTGSHRFTMASGENRSFSNRGAGCLYNISVDSHNHNRFPNRCQNWEFLITPGPEFGEIDGFIHRGSGPIQKKYPPTGSNVRGAAFFGRPESIVDFSVQRSLASTLAKEASAPKTQGLIEGDACFEDILASAVSEIGAERLIPMVLGGPVEWAHHALQHVTLSTEQQAQLAARVAEDAS